MHGVNFPISYYAIERNGQTVLIFKISHTWSWQFVFCEIQSITEKGTSLRMKKKRFVCVYPRFLESPVTSPLGGWLMGCKLRNGPVGGWGYHVSTCRQVIVFSMPWSRPAGCSWRCRNKDQDDGWPGNFLMRGRARPGFEHGLYNTKWNTPVRRSVKLD